MSMQVHSIQDRLRSEADSHRGGKNSGETVEPNNSTYFSELFLESEVCNRPGSFAIVQEIVQVILLRE